MIDTIRLEIRGLSPADIEAVKVKLDSHLVLENETGLVRSEFTAGSLRGSWDSRISVQVRDYEFVALEQREQRIKAIGCLSVVDCMSGPSMPHKVEADPYLVIEFSLPKWAEGVNFINSSLDLDLSRLVQFREWLVLKFGFDLPPLAEWLVKRVDIAYCFDMRSYHNILHYVKACRNLDFTRRKKPQFYQDSFFSSGSTTTLKAYAKETEFKKHDFKRIALRFQDKFIAKQVHELTKGLFRFEVEFKRRKLEQLQVFAIADLSSIDWEKEMKTEIYKLIKGGKSGKVFKFTEVLQMLRTADLKGKGITADSASAIWSAIVLEGDKYAKAQFGARKYYRAMNVFKDLDITVLGLIQETKISPILTEVNLIAHEVSNGDHLRKQYLSLFKKAA
ncbi:MAG: phage/plasmid replication protein [Nanopusillaceae archaeon]